MMTSILIGVGGGLLLELLGLSGAGKAAALGRAVPVLLRLVGLIRRLRERMTDQERQEADSAVSEAERIAFGKQ